MFATVLGGFYEYGRTAKSHPLAPWNQSGSAAYAFVVNRTADTIPVCALARKVDRAIRCMGWIPAQDSGFLKLPYADADVILLLGYVWQEVKVDGPKVYRLVVP